MLESRVQIRTLIVEDEPHMRRYLCEMLTTVEEVVVVGEASNGLEGASQIRMLSPDLVFLDIRMPELDGFGLIADIGMKKMPAFVFVTAHSEHAIRAFELDAIDYLCKPFDRDRLLVSLERAMRHIRTGEKSISQDNNEHVNRSTDHQLSRITVKEKDKITFIPVEDILWIEAADKYVVVHTADCSHLLRQTMNSLEERLDPRQFLRIHRSVLVRKTAVQGLRPLFHGDYILKLNNGKELTLSRNFRGSFFSQMSR